MNKRSWILFCLGVFLMIGAEAQYKDDSFDFSSLNNKDLFFVYSDSSILHTSYSFLESKKFPFKLKAIHSDVVSDMELDNSMFFILPKRVVITDSLVNYSLDIIQGKSGLTIGQPEKDGFFSLHQALKPILYIHISPETYSNEMISMYTLALMKSIKHAYSNQTEMMTAINSNLYSMEISEIIFENRYLDEQFRNSDKFENILINGYICGADAIDTFLNDPSDQAVLANCAIEYTSKSTAKLHRYLYDWTLGLVYYDEKLIKDESNQGFDRDLLKEINSIVSKSLPSDFRRKRSSGKGSRNNTSKG